uniref:DNA helicase Pif1-like 2B domain-containing protein n=2 Tax=Aegilops tauschii subsp. strangulata TaxID=200361 RepID=A0A453F1T5_AEGTS
MLSLDTVCKATTNTNIMMNMQPTEFLNTLTSPGIPDHKLKLKVGLPVMLLESSCHQATQNGHSCFFIWQWMSTLLNIPSSLSYHIQKITIPTLIPLMNSPQFSISFLSDPRKRSCEGLKAPSNPFRKRDRERRCGIHLPSAEAMVGGGTQPSQRRAHALVLP